MTLFVTPVMYSLLNSRHDKKLAKREIVRKPDAEQEHRLHKATLVAETWNNK
jgi:hypothetical protein